MKSMIPRGGHLLSPGCSVPHKRPPSTRSEGRPAVETEQPPAGKDGPDLNEGRSVPEMRRQLKVAYLTGIYPRATDTFIQREVAALRRLGHTVDTFSIRRPSEEHLVGEEQRAERKATLYVLQEGALRIARANVVGALTSPLRYLRALGLAIRTRSPGAKALLYQGFYLAEASFLAREMRRRGVEHIHLHFADASCTVGMLAAELAGCTFSFTIHGPSIYFAPRRWSLDVKAKRALFVSCISDFCRSQLMIFSAREDWHKFHIIHCGITPSLFAQREHVGVGTNILWVGRLADVKGLPILFDALASMEQRNIRVSLVGDGPDREALERQVNEQGLGDVVEFLGFRSQAEVRERMSRADVFVLPSFAEGVPVVLMEAMAAGVPVVATRIAGISELVEDGLSGFTVPPGNADQLRHAIERLLGDSDLRRRFGERGRNKVATSFNVDTEGRRLASILTERLEHHRGGAESEPGAKRMESVGAQVAAECSPSQPPAREAPSAGQDQATAHSANRANETHPENATAR